MEISAIFFRAVLAALPILGLTLRAKSGFVYGAVGAGVLISTVLIFSAVRFVIPERVHRLSTLFLFLILGTIGIENFSLSPLLLVSLSLLAAIQFSRRRENWVLIAKETLLLGFCFWAILTGHGILSNLLGERLGVEFFKLPSGSYFLTGLALTIMRKK